MPPELVVDDDQIINGKTYYMKMFMRRDVSELYSEIMSDSSSTRYFYDELNNNVNKFNELFSNIIGMTPSERIMRLSTLPPIPEFLHGTYSAYLKIQEDQHKEIGRLSKYLNTSMSNLTMILFYLSIPPRLYIEFPYLATHYMIVETVINIYLEKIDNKNRLNEYDTIKTLSEL